MTLPDFRSEALLGLSGTRVGDHQGHFWKSGFVDQSCDNSAHI